VIPLLISISLGADPAELLAVAEESYRAGLEARADTATARPHFRRSAEAYDRLWESGRRTPAVARNMAQARLLAGDVGRAIRDYRRGLRLAPHDAELRDGLEFARSQVAYPRDGELGGIAGPRDTESLAERLRLPFPALVSAVIVVSAAGWFVLARAWITARGGLALFGGTLVLAAIAFGGWLWWEDDRLRARWAEPTAVVIALTDLRTGNSDEYPRRIDVRLPAGVEVRVLGDRGGWLHVELADGTAGWVPGRRAAVVD
jgi:hypothetical protein